VKAVAYRRATGVTSSNPVLLLATGLNVPDDLMYEADAGTVLVGEHGSGHIARIGGASRLARLPQVVPEAEGIAQIGGTVYIADQLNARILALSGNGLRTVLRLQPVPSGENLDGIAATATQLIVPDSPHGTVLVVDPSGHVAARYGGFSRPAGTWVEPNGRYLIADENANAVFELRNGGAIARVAGNLAGADDVARAADGHVLVTLPGLGILRDVTTGLNVAQGLRNPQGLGFDGAQNILVTESDAGRLDLIVKTFVIEVPAPAVRLAPGQGVCLGILRATGFTGPITVDQFRGASVAVQPSASASLEVVPDPCSLAICTVSIAVSSPSGRQLVDFTYRD
jgi:DNA-binding beta-propeller fold protein YncE